MSEGSKYCHELMVEDVDLDKDTNFDSDENLDRSQSDSCDIRQSAYFS